MREKIYIQGMTCTACSSGIERALKRKKGINEIRVDLLNGYALIDFNQTQISLQEICAFIQKLGYTPHTQGWIEKIDQSLLTPKKRILLGIIFTAICVYLGMIGMLYPALIPSFFTPILNNLIQCFCALVVMHLGRDFYLRGLKHLFSFQPNMDSLVALGSGSAFVFSLPTLWNPFYSSYFESVCVIIVFVLIGKTLEEKAKSNTQNSLLALASLKDNTTIRICNHQEEVISVHQIQIGDILKITPQSYIPTEGKIIQGYANLDLSSLNGESIPVVKKEGELVLSGALNLNTTCLIQATQKAQDCVYWQMIDLVQNTLISKAPIAKIADQISRYFVPCVIALATLSASLWFFLAQDFDLSLQIFCSVLLISCPCALGLATPLALNIATHLASQKGIFFKDASILELISQTQVVFLDKTGTLTQKQLQIQNIVSLSSLEQTELLQIAISLEKESSHIIAQSILSFDPSIAPLPVSDLQIKEGYGIQGIIASKLYKIGNAKSFNPPPLSQEEGVIVWIGRENGGRDEILGYLSLKEQLKEEAKEVIRQLKALQITPILLSGDTQNNVAKIANILEIAFIAEATPQDKLNALTHQKEKITMMIGDGINDILALSKAHISVSMGEGAQEAIASSSLIILNNHLQSIPHAIALSQATIKNIKQNLFWAFGYNVCMIPIACGAFLGIGLSLNPMFASLAMTLSSLSVVFNAQRLKTFKG